MRHRKDHADLACAGGFTTETAQTLLPPCPYCGEAGHWTLRIDTTVGDDPLARRHVHTYHCRLCRMVFGFLWPVDQAGYVAGQVAEFMAFGTIEEVVGRRYEPFRGMINV